MQYAMHADTRRSRWMRDKQACLHYGFRFVSILCHTLWTEGQSLKFTSNSATVSPTRCRVDISSAHALDLDSCQLDRLTAKPVVREISETVFLLSRPLPHTIIHYKKL